MAPAVDRPVASATDDITTSTTPIARSTGFAKASDGTRLYFEKCGNGPAMVFIHGLGGNHSAWFQQVPFFARSHTVITVSQRGFAPSGGDPDRYDVDVLVADLLAVMDAAGVKRAVIVGQSMGGWTALGAALRAPDRVSSLVLADTLGGISDGRIAAHMQKVTAAAERLRSQAPPLGVHPALSPDFSRNRPDLAYLYQTMATFGSPRPDVISKQLAAARVSAGDVKRLRIPVLFIVGSGDTLFPPDLVRRGAAFVRRVQVSEIASAGHSAYYENPQLWNLVVARFLKKEWSK